MKLSTLRRARIAREDRSTAIVGTLVIMLILTVLALISAPGRREYNQHMMCDVYGHQEWCGGVK